MYYDNAFRINLKPDSEDRRELIDFCLNHEQQYVAIGWSYLYNEPEVKITDYKSYYDAVAESVHKNGEKINHAHNVFLDVEEGDLFWTRDMDGTYWICRSTGNAKTLPEIGLSVEQGKRLDVGAVVPVKAFPVGTQVPEKIKASFIQPHAGIIQEIKDEEMTRYAKTMYNKCSGEKYYFY